MEHSPIFSYDRRGGTLKLYRSSLVPGNVMFVYAVSTKARDDGHFAGHPQVATHWFFVDTSLATLIAHARAVAERVEGAQPTPADIERYVGFVIRALTDQAV